MAVLLSLPLELVFVHLCMRVHILSLTAYMPVPACVSLLCTHPIGVEVSPFGLFNRHQLSFVLQEMDAVDFYPRIHKLWASWSLGGWWIQSVRRPMPNVPLPTPLSPTMAEIKRWVCLYLISIYFFFFFYCMPCTRLFLPSLFSLLMLRLCPFSQTCGSERASCDLIPLWEGW